MHPTIRLVCLLVFSAALAMGGTAGVILATVLLAGCSAGVKTLEWRAIGRMVRRLRWLMLSLVILYGWFTAADPLWGWAGAPSAAGLMTATWRVAVLVLMVWAVSLLMQTTTPPDLLAGLYGLARLLRPLGIAPERVAVRLSLVLTAVPAAQAVVSRAWAAPSATGWGQVGATLAQVYAEILKEAAQAPLTPVTLPLRPMPPVLQWGYPIVLLAAFIGVGMAL